MCKILVLPKIDTAKNVQTNLRKFIKVVRPYLTSLDKDGFGWMNWGNNGLHTEAWLNPDNAFKSGKQLNEISREIEAEWAGCLSSEANYKQTGKPNSVITSLALHARMATSSVNLANTHPFVREDSALIHNGIVKAQNLTLINSTCDSEGILNAYLDLGVNLNLANVNCLTTRLDGYYACAIYSKDSSGQPILDILKDAKANLHAVYVPALRTVVFCTSILIIHSACKLLNWQIGDSYKVKDNTLTRVNLDTGKVSMVEFIPYAEKLPAEVDTSYLNNSWDNASWDERVADNEAIRSADYWDKYAFTKRRK